jgi:hypothetical protein
MELHRDVASRELPAHERSTYDLLCAAYPRSIRADDYLPLISVLASTGMSNRSIAAAFANYASRPYVDFLYDIGHVAPNAHISLVELERVRQQLLPHGFEAWVIAP